MTESVDLNGAIADAVSRVSRFVAAFHPCAAVALLAGSQVQGQAVTGSDYDVVLIFEALPGVGFLVHTADGSERDLTNQPRLTQMRPNWGRFNFGGHTLLDIQIQLPCDDLT
jgi:hypothetical protein